jgi:hypothetical protein
MCPFPLVMKHLHNVADGAKGMCFLMEVMCEFRSMAIVVEGTFVFFLMYGEASSSLSHVGFPALTDCPS